MLEEKPLNCPYCGEAITILVDLSVGNQHNIEDCFVCCRPIELHIEIDGDNITLSGHTDYD